MLQTPEPSKSLAKDERGAVMIMGLAMILGLVAFLWYLLGIGETVAFRDHMQDAADGAAFSQSAVNALGMNLIVFINLVIMIMVVIYLVMSIVVTVQYFKALSDCAKPIVGWVACPFIMLNYYNKWRNRNSRAKTMANDIDKPLSYIESGIALGAPLLGSFAAWDDIKDFKTTMMSDTPFGFSAGETNVPQMAALNLKAASEPDPGADGGKKDGPRYGLPVTHEHLAYDCAHIITAIGSLAASFLGPAKKFINMISGALGTVTQWYYCSDEPIPPGIIPGGKIMGVLKKLVPAGLERALIGGGDGADYWYKDGYGPMENWMHKGVSGFFDSLKTTEKRHEKEDKNSADRMQTYGFVILPKDGDHHATHNIKLMQLHNSGWASGEDQKPAPYGYFANAELYFDCTDKWSTDECANIEGTDAMDMTMYRFEWRARLVKFHVPTKTGGEVYNVIQNTLDMFSSVKAAVNGSGADKFISIITDIDSIFGTDILGTLGKIADMPPAEVYH